MDDLASHLDGLFARRQLHPGQFYEDYRFFLAGQTDSDRALWHTLWHTATTVDYPLVATVLAKHSFASPRGPLDLQDAKRALRAEAILFTVDCYQVLEALSGFLDCPEQRQPFEKVFVQQLGKLGIVHWHGAQLVRGVVFDAWRVNDTAEDVVEFVAVLVPGAEKVNPNDGSAVFAINFSPTTSFSESMVQAHKQVLELINDSSSHSVLRREFLQLYWWSSFVRAIAHLAQFFVDLLLRGKFGCDVAGYLQRCSVGFIVSGFSRQREEDRPLPSLHRQSGFFCFFSSVFGALLSLRLQKGWTARQQFSLPASLRPAVERLAGDSDRLIFSLPPPHDGVFPQLGNPTPKRDTVDKYALLLRPDRQPVAFFVPTGTQIADTDKVRVREVASLREALLALGSVPPWRQRLAQFLALMYVVAPIVAVAFFWMRFGSEIVECYSDRPIPEYDRNESKYSHARGPSDELRLVLPTDFPSAFSVRLAGSRVWKDAEWPLSAAKLEKGKWVLRCKLEWTGVELSGTADGELHIVRKRKLPFLRPWKEVVGRDPLASVASPASWGVFP